MPSKNTPSAGTVSPLMDNGHMTDSHVQLIVAAAGATGPVPTEAAGRGVWLASVTELAADLYRSAQGLGALIEEYDQCKVIPGLVVRVEEHSGRGIVILKPHIGDNQDEPERLRTPWLNEPRGAALFAQARALVGQNVRVGKWVEQFKDPRDDGKSKKMVFLSWIEPAGRVEQAERSAPAAARRDPAPLAADTRPSKDDPLDGVSPPSTLADLLELATVHMGLDTQGVADAGTRALATATPMADWKQPHVVKVWRELVASVPF